MIQRINNVLVKHNKILFTVLLVIIVIGFVLFFGAMDPGSFFSAIFSSRSANHIGSVFDQNITRADMRNAYRTLIVAEAPGVYAQNPIAAQNLRLDVKEDMMFGFAVALKAAEKLGFSVSDKEVSRAVTAMPVFRKDGKFDQAAYDKFKNECLSPNGFNKEDFERAIRNMLLVQKFESFDGGAVTVTDDEIARALADVTEKLTIQNVTFSPKSFLDGISVSDAELQSEYDKNKTSYMSLPVSDALIVRVRFADIKDVPAVTDAQVDEQFKLFPPKDKDGKPLPEKEAKELIRKDLTAEAREKAGAAALSKIYIAIRKLAATDEFKKAPEQAFRQAAGEAGFAVAELKKLTAESPALPDAGSRLIRAICEIPALYGFTQPVREKDSAAFAMLTGRIDPVQLPLSEVKDKIRGVIVQRKAAAKAMEAARSFRAAVIAKKIAPDAIAEAAKAAGGTAGPKQEITRLQQLLPAYQTYKMLQDPKAVEAFLASVPEPYREMALSNLAARTRAMGQLIVPTVEPAGFVSEPVMDAYSDEGAGMTCLLARTPAATQPDQTAKDAVAAALTLSKKAQARAEWLSWVYSNIKDFRPKNGNSAEEN